MEKAMWLTRIEISNFRNYSSAVLEPTRELNILYGANGAGKTNLLEAIGLLSHGRSIRLRHLETLIKNDCLQGHLRGGFVDERGRSMKIDCLLDKQRGKRILVNGKAVARVSEVFRLVPTMQCFEEDVKLLHGSPAIRRRFLDCLCSQLFPDYLDLHKAFREVLQERNEWLRTRPTTENAERLGETLQELYIARSVKVIERRLRALELLQDTLANLRGELHEEGSLALVHKRLEERWSIEDVRDDLKRRLVTSRREERKRFTTIIGPHREGFEFMLDEAKIRDRCSRGQIKNMVLRVKMAEFELLKRELKRLPIILLDDVFAEMDLSRRENLAALSQRGAQVFWTTVGALGLPMGHETRVAYFEIDDGAIRERGTRECAA
jgi:DNA replication and repair protein RecF